MTTLTANRRYTITPPGITAKVVLIDRDGAGNPAQVWLEHPGQDQPMLVIVEPGMTFTPEPDPEPTKPAYTVRDLGHDDRPAEELVAEATQARGPGPVTGSAEKLLPGPGEDA